MRRFDLICVVVVICLDLVDLWYFFMVVVVVLVVVDDSVVVVCVVGLGSCMLSFVDGVD